MAEKNIFETFAREHTKFIYFLLAAPVAAIGYVQEDIAALEAFHCAHILLGLAVFSWVLSFGIGCYRLKSMLAGLYKVTQDDLLHDPSANDRQLLAAATKQAGSSAEWQLWSLFAGVPFYVLWVFLG